MKLIALAIGLFMAVFPILGFAWGVHEGVRHRPPCFDLSHGRTP